MKKILVTSLTFFMCVTLLFAQHETDERVMGYKHFVKFNQNYPELTIETPNFFDPTIWHANGDDITHYANSICDTLGYLLFYYDGINVYDKNKVKLPNGNIHTKNFSSYYHSTLIVPIEETNRRYYYLFETIPYEENWANAQNACGPTTACPEFLELCKLQYHIIDMGVDGTQGKIISKNNLVIDSVASTLSGVKHQNNIDTWVTVMKFKSNKIYNFKVNSCIISEPVISVVPDFEYEIKPINYSYVFRFTFGFQIIYSTKGDYVTFNGYKLSDPLPTGDDIRYSYLYYTKFDNTTGLVDIVSLNTTGPSSSYRNTYTVGPALFSHDSGKIYYFSQQLAGDIIQFDLNTNISIVYPYYGGTAHVSPLDYGKNNDFLLNIITPLSSVVSFPYTPPFYYNNYSYFSYTQNWFLLGNINDTIVVNGVTNTVPNLYRSPIFDPLTRNNYIYNFYHPDYKKPNAFPVAQLISNTVVSPSCFNTPITLKGNTNIPVDSLYWVVKKTGQNNWQRFDADTFDLPVSPGTYTASLVSYKYCLVDSATQQFTIEDYPVVNLANDTMYTCDSKTVELPSDNTYSYYWQNVHGETIPSQVSETGQYNIVVQNSCGSKEDSLYLKSSTLDVTNLVTANNDNQNDCLYAASNNKNESIRMSIYNSWGNRVFSDNNYKNNWCPGNDLSDGVYYYEANYNNNCSKKGWVEIVH